MWTGLAFLPRRGMPRQALVTLSIVAVCGSLLIPYLRAKAEALGLEGKGGLMGRAERLLVFGLGVGLEGFGLADARRHLVDPGGRHLGDRGRSASFGPGAGSQREAGDRLLRLPSPRRPARAAPGAGDAPPRLLGRLAGVVRRSPAFCDGGPPPDPCRRQRSGISSGGPPRVHVVRALLGRGVLDAPASAAPGARHHRARRHRDTPRCRRGRQGRDRRSTAHGQLGGGGSARRLGRRPGARCRRGARQRARSCSGSSRCGT